MRTQTIETVDPNALRLMSMSELNDLHYMTEISYRRRIIESPKASRERAESVSEAYESLVAILTERRRRVGREMDALGLPGNAADELSAHLGPPPARMLDVGCGTGVLVEALRTRGYDARGVDVSSRLIDTGKARMAARPESNQFNNMLYCGNFMYSRMFSDESFDLVYSNDVMEHLHPDEAEDFLRKAYDLLRPGGSLWLITPNRWTGPGDATILRHPPGTESRGLHLKEYKLTELRSLLHGVGFTTRARLWSGGKFRKPTRFRGIHARLKATVEPIFASLPPKARRKLMWIMDYSCVLAVKPFGETPSR